MTRAEFDEKYCAATTPKRKKEITLQYIASLEARNKELENKQLQAISIETSFQNKYIKGKENLK